MKKLRKIIGWFLVLMCATGLFQSIAAIVTIFTSVGDEVYWAKKQLPTFLFLTVVFGWIAFYLLSKRKSIEAPPMDGKEVPIEKVKTIYKVLIYLCEAVVVWLGTLIICGIVMLTTNSVSLMQLAMLISIIGIICFLPSPQKVFNYWKRRKHQ